VYGQRLHRQQQDGGHFGEYGVISGGGVHCEADNGGEVGTGTSMASTEVLPVGTSMASTEVLPVASWCG
jgi:hypothetical protein